MLALIRERWSQIKELSGIPAFFNLVLIFMLVSISLFAVAHYNNFYNDPGWVNDVLVEAHGMWFDIVVLGLLAAVLGLSTERKQNIQRYSEEIEDFLAWESDESAHRIAGNIRRLNRLGVSPKNLRGVNLSNIDLHGVDLSGTDLSKAKLLDTILTEAVLLNADLSGADLTDAHLKKTDLRGASLINVKGSGAWFQSADLRGADLREANFSRANFQGALLICSDLGKTLLFQADLRGAKLAGANLSNANLTKAKFIEAQIQRSILCKTKFSEDIRIDANRDCVESNTES